MPRKMLIQTDPGFVGGMTVAFDFEIGADESPDTLADLAVKTIERVRAQQDLLEALTDVAAREEVLAKYPELAAGLLRDRTEQRVRRRARMQREAEIRRGGRPLRIEWEEGAKEKQDLAAFDLETEELAQKLKDQKEQAERELPMWRERVERARLILGGKSRAEVIQLKVVAA